MQGRRTAAKWNREMGSGALLYLVALSGAVYDMDMDRSAAGRRELLICYLCHILRMQPYKMQSKTPP